MRRLSQSIFDILQNFPGFVMLIQRKPILPIDDKSAETLYNLWKESTKDGVVTDVKADNLTTLVEKGYIRQKGKLIEITDKGQKLVLEMGLSQPNRFSKDTTPSYSEIKLRSANQRKRVTFTKKASKDVQSFNLKKVRNDSVNKKQDQSKDS